VCLAYSFVATKHDQRPAHNDQQHHDGSRSPHFGTRPSSISRKHRAISRTTASSVGATAVQARVLWPTFGQGDRTPPVVGATNDLARDRCTDAPRNRRWYYPWAAPGGTMFGGQLDQ
jgi:hypothetical protein